jgi:hypothetical protein
MNTKDRFVIKALERRIEFYRKIGIAVFFGGLLAGGSILLGRPAMMFPELSEYSRITIQILAYFSIALTGILIIFEHRRRISILKSRRNKILRDIFHRESVPYPAREQLIIEIQVLYGILFFLAVLITCVGCPFPPMPAFLDRDLVRFAALIGFFILCWLSVGTERKNSVVISDAPNEFARKLVNRAKVRRERKRVPAHRAAVQGTFGASRIRRAHSGRMM